MNSLFAIANRIWAPRFAGSVTGWCCAHLHFDEAGNHGAFTVTGAEYVADILEDFQRIDVSDEVIVAGSQVRKTGTLMGGLAWAMVNDPCGVLWVLPNIDLARKFSRQRWQKMIERSNATSALLPRGARRHSWATLQQVVGGCTINFVGSNAAAGLASNPCRRVILDEVEKFNAAPNAEADAVNLAEQRTKNQPAPQRWKTSTPAMSNGLIWTEYLKGDQRRYQLQCPSCTGPILLAWSRHFTVLPLTGKEAWIKWDPGAKSGGEWNLELVERTAYAECPHCHAHITNEQKPAMIRGGKWVATSAAAKGFVSRHLSSLYSTATECSWGKLAVKFLQAKASLSGLQGFINGDLAEPYVAQETIKARASSLTSHLEVGAEWQRILTVDCQARSPYFWYIVRAWDEKVGSRAVASGNCETWDDVRAVQAAQGVHDRRVFVDSGFGARSESEVYRECAHHADIWEHDGHVIKIGGLAGLRGWMPTKGLPGRRRWTDPDTQSMHPFYLRATDPFLGTAKAGVFALELLEFASDTFSDVLAALADNKTAFKWTVGEAAATEEYWHHWESEVKTWMVNARTNKGAFVWKLRSAKWPNHLRDCEKIQVAAAVMLGLLNIEPEKETKK